MLEALAQSDAIQAMERKGACFKTSVVQKQASSEEQSDVDKAISESLLAQQQRQHESRSAKRSRQLPKGKLWEAAKSARRFGEGFEFSQHPSDVLRAVGLRGF